MHTPPDALFSVYVALSIHFLMLPSLSYLLPTAPHTMGPRQLNLEVMPWRPDEDTTKDTRTARAWPVPWLLSQELPEAHPSSQPLQKLHFPLGSSPQQGCCSSCWWWAWSLWCGMYRLYWLPSTLGKKKNIYFWILTFFLSFSNFSIPVWKKRIWLLFHSTREFHNALQSYIKSWKRKQLPTATKMPWCSTYSKQRKHYQAGLFIF